MSGIIVIGTLHAGLTPHGELMSVLEHCHPDQLFVEIQEKDLREGNIERYPDEMVVAATWAKENNIPVVGFDAPIQTRANSKTEIDNQAVIEQQKKFLAGYSWKDANTKTIADTLNTMSASLTDLTKEQRREHLMFEIIQKQIRSDKRTVILTGVGHLTFFERCLPDALFPFRHHRSQNKVDES